MLQNKQFKPAKWMLPEGYLCKFDIVNFCVSRKWLNRNAQHKNPIKDTNRPLTNQQKETEAGAPIPTSLVTIGCPGNPLHCSEKVSCTERSCRCVNLNILLFIFPFRELFDTFLFPDFRAISSFFHSFWSVPGGPLI